MDPELQKQQLELAKQMLEALQSQERTLRAIQELQAGQSGIHQETAVAIEEHADAMSQLNEQQSAFNGVMEEGSKQNETFTQSLQGWLNKGNSKLTEGLSLAVGQLSENFSMLADVITNPLQASMGFLSTFFDYIFELANERIQDMLHFREALERVRKEFGSFTENTSKRVRETYDGFGASLKQAAGGVNVFASKFNMGMEGAIERLDLVRELAGAMGPTLDVLGDEFNDSAANLYVMRDALLFNEQALKNVSTMSILSSKSLKQFSDETLASVNKIGRQLGISSKVLGKDVGAFLSNFKSLGRMTGDYVTEITKAAAYTRKLGIELNELIGLNQKFDDFETGAEAAAQLAAAFGMVLDPVKLIQAQNPAEVLDDLQKAFAATGRSFETLSRQDKALLTSQSGLTEEQAALAFSAKGLSMSYDEVKTAADGAMKGHKTQEEIMRDLADSIENVIIPIQRFTSFFDAFIKGFMDAFDRSKPVQDAVNNIAKALLETYYAGMRTFSAFLQVPGVTKALQGLLDVVTTIGDIFSKVALEIEKFTIAMSTDPKNAAKNLMTGITSVITDGFNGLFTGKNGQPSIFDNLMEGLTQTFLAVAAALPGIVLGLVRSLKTVLSNLTKTMRQAFTKPADGSPSIGQGLLEGIKDGFSELVRELPSFMPILIEFGSELVAFLGRAIQEFPFATLFVTGGPILTAASGIFGQLKDTVMGLFTGGGTTEEISEAARQADESAKAQNDLAAALNKQGAAMTGTGPDSFGGLVGMFGGAATKAAEYGAIALGISLIGASIIKLVRSVLEPPEGGGKSLIQLFADAGATLSTVNADGLQNAFLITGAVLVAAMGGIAAILMGVASMDKGDLFAKLAGGAVSVAVLAGISHIFDAVIPKVTAMISSMTTYLSSPEFAAQLKNINSLAASVKPEDIDAMGNLGKIFSSVGTMMGTMIKVATDLNSLPGIPTVVATTTNPDGTITEVMGEESPSSKIARIMGYISSMVGNKDEKVGIVGVISKFEDSLGGDLATATQKFQTLALILDPMSKMMSTFGTAGLDFIKTSASLAAGGSTATAEDSMDQVRKFIGAVGGGAVDILNDINSRVNLSKDQVDALSGKVSLISTVATFLGSFGKSITELLKSVQAFDVSGNVVSAMSSLNSLLFGTGSGVIETDTESIPVEASDGIIQMMTKVINNLATALNDPANAIDQTQISFFTEIFAPSGALMGMISAISAASKVATTDIESAKTFLDTVAGNGDLTASFPTHLFNALNSFKAFDGIDLEALAKRETNMKGSFNVLGTYIAGMTEKLPGDVAKRVNASLEQLQQIKAAMAETAKVLEALDTVRLDAAVEGFGTKMNVVKKKFDINNGAVSITVNMNVTMSAQKMAETLVLDGFVKPNVEFADYLQSPDSVRSNQYDFYTTEYKPGSPESLLETRRNDDSWRGE